jgi:hypothetical protein
LYGQGFFLGLGVLSGFVFNAVHRGTLPLASVGRPNPFFKVGIVSLQIGLQIGLIELSTARLAVRTTNTIPAFSSTFVRLMLGGYNYGVMMRSSLGLK